MPRHLIKSYKLFWCHFIFLCVYEYISHILQIILAQPACLISPDRSKAKRRRAVKDSMYIDPMLGDSPAEKKQLYTQTVF